MNKELTEILELYFTEKTGELGWFLSKLNKDGITDALIELLDLYANDVNSSTLRELITTVKAGYQPQLKGAKLGYNGFKQDAFSGITIKCEAKPKNVDTNSESKDKLKGYGNFSDYTFKRLAKDKHSTN